MKNKGLNDFLAKQTEDNTEKGKEKKDLWDVPEVKKKKKTPLKSLQPNSELDNTKESKEVVKTLDLDDFSFNSLLKDIATYKEDFNLSSHFNVRLSEDNYQALKKLKATDVKMVHLVNLAITKIVKSKDYNKFIKG